MSDELSRDLGEQPLAALLRELALSPHALVAASTEQLTHKVVAKACKGRRLTPKLQAKVCRALNAATGGHYSHRQVFDY